MVHSAASPSIPVDRREPYCRNDGPLALSCIGDSETKKQNAWYHKNLLSYSILWPSNHSTSYWHSVDAAQRWKAKNKTLLYRFDGNRMESPCWDLFAIPFLLRSSLPSPLNLRPPLNVIVLHSYIPCPPLIGSLRLLSSLLARKLSFRTLVVNGRTMPS